MPNFDFSTIGKTMVFAGVVVLTLGLVFWGLGSLPIALGKLPGDIHIRGEKWSIYFPIATCLLISIVLTIVLNIVVRFFR